MATPAPSRTIASAIAYPIPLLPPVTIAALPSSVPAILPPVVR